MYKKYRCNIFQIIREVSVKIEREKGVSGEIWQNFSKLL